VLGDVVNLSARLMQAADELLPILVDNYTFTAARGHFLFEAYPPINVKGKAQPIAIHSPASTRLPSAPSARPLSGPVPAASGNGGRSPLVGRMRERVVLVGKLHELLRGRSATVVVEGEAGLGKSRLADDLVDQAETMGIARLIGARDQLDGASAYHTWTPVFRTLSGSRRAAPTRSRGTAAGVDGPQHARGGAARRCWRRCWRSTRRTASGRRG
jgi:hypothetical protein